MFDESETIGYRHLSWTNAISADKVRVTIVESQAVPLIQSIGVYKAVGAFEGLTSIDSKIFTTTQKWTTEDEGIWTKVVGASASTTFTGTRFYVTGIVDQGHGNIEVYVDDKKVATVNYKSKIRQLRQILYTSDDVVLSYGEHTVKLVCASEAIALHSLLYLDNKDQGMFEIASSEYSVNEDQTVTVQVKRVGGKAKKATVTFQTAPCTAVHGKNYIDITKTLVFEAGDDEHQFIDVETIYYEEPTGDLNFYTGIVDPTDDAITVFNHSSVVNIIDIESEKKMNVSNFNKKSLNEKIVFYVLAALMTNVVVVAITFLVVKKKKDNQHNPIPLNNSDQNVYTN